MLGEIEGLILHSDLGSQYTSYEFAQYVKEHRLIHSFSGKGNPYDNACIKSFHSVLKKEEVNLVKYFLLFACYNKLSYLC